MAENATGVGGRAALIERLGEVLVWLTIAWAVFAIGATTGVGVLGLWGLAVLSCVVNALAGRFRVDGGVALLFALAVHTLLQSVRLPTSVVELFDSDLARTWAQTFELLGEPVQARFSLQPLTTRLEALKLCAYASIWGCIGGLVARRGLDMVIGRVVVLVAAVLAVTLLHRALGWQKVYTWYEPRYVQPYWVGPLLNVNNLGGVCNLGTFAALALTFRAVNDDRKWLLLIAAALAFVGMTLLTGSRGAVAALTLGLCAFALNVWRHRRVVPIRRFGVVLVVAIALTLSALLLDRERLLGNLADLSTEKVNTMRWALLVARTHGFWGIGKGALDAEIPTVQPAVGSLLFPYVECFPLDWAIAWGVPIAVLLVTALVKALARVKGGLRTSTLRLGLGVVLAQNLFDLGLEVPGLAVPVVCVFAALWTSTPVVPWNRPLSGRVVVAALGGFVGGAAALGIPTQFAAEARREVTRAATLGDPGDREALMDALRYNPGDHTLLRAMALHGAAVHDKHTLSWVNLALLRAPHSALTHLTLAQVLWVNGASRQAIGAFREAVKDARVHDEVLTWLASRAPNVWLDVAPPGRVGAEFLRRAAMGLTDSEQQRQLLEAAVARAPTSPDVRAEFLEWQMGAIVRGQDPACANVDACVDNLQQQLRLLDESTQNTRSGDASAQLRARLLAIRLRSLRGDVAAAFEELQPICQAAATDVRCATLLLELGKKRGGEAFEEAANHYLDVVCVAPPRCIPERIEVARELAAGDRLTAALRQYVIAAGAGGDARAFVGASEVAARLGREHEALHWLNKGEQRLGTDAAFEAQRRRLGLAPRMPD